MASEPALLGLHNTTILFYDVFYLKILIGKNGF